MNYRLLCLPLAVAIVAGSAGSTPAFHGSIGIYSDASATSCLVDDSQPGTITLYVMQTNSSGATASQFRVVNDDGFTGIFVAHSVAPGFLDLGMPEVDYSVAYGGCMIGTYVLTTLTYQGLGTSGGCRHIAIGPAPTSPVPGEIAIVDCSSNLVAGSTREAIVNYGAGCNAWCIAPVATSTWGEIKALYR